MFGEMIGSAISAAANAGLAKKTFEYQKELAAQQNQYNIDMWRMNNEYNTPAAQMQRFQEAGLNPNLIYGQGSAGNSSSAPQQVVPNAPDYSHAMSDISKMGTLLDIANRVETLRAQRKDNELRDKNLAKADYTNSSLDAKQQLDWMKMLGYVNWAQSNGLSTGNGNASSGGRYFERLYDLSLKRIIENNMNTSVKSALYRTQTMLNNLQSNYYRVRNAWQPWQYGVDMGVDALGGILGIRKLFQKQPQKVMNVYNTRYSTFHDYHSKF